jgi:vacuolar iron transporter family protein
MKQINKEKFQSGKNKFLFGSSAAIITNLGIIAGLLSSHNAQGNIIGSMLVIAIADNISDTLGIHIYQEAEGLKVKEVWLSSLTNFASRFFVSSIFVLLVATLPLKIAAISCLVFSFVVISLISYFIAIFKKRNPFVSIFEHLAVASAVIVISKFLGDFIIGHFYR